MCKYYAHAFTCKHVSFTFARFCNPASLIQTPCNKRQIWHTISLDEGCEECRLWFPDRYPPSGGGGVVGGPAGGASRIRNKRR